MENIITAVGAFLYDIYESCNSNLVLLYFAFCAIGAAVVFLANGANISNMFISSLTNEKMEEMNANRSKRDAIEPSKVLMASGYSMFANVWVFIVKLLLCLAFAYAFTSEAFDGVNTVLFGAELKLSMLEYIKMSAISNAMVITAIGAVFFQAFLYYIYEGYLMVDHKTVDIVLVIVLIVCSLFFKCGFVFVWLVLCFAEALIYIVYMTVLREKKLEKTIKVVDASIARYEAQLDVLEKDAKDKKNAGKKKKRK